MRARTPMRIALCVRGFTRILNVLRERLPHDEIVECDATQAIDVAREVDVLIPIMTPIPAAAFAGSRVALVQQYGVGLEGVDIAAATAAGVFVANVPSVGTGNAESVAEFAIMLMMMLGRDLRTAKRRFSEQRFGSPLGHSLYGATVVILGYGGIGEAIARRLAGFGTRLIAVSRHGPGGARARDPAVRLDRHVALSECGALLGEADFVVVAAPAQRENHGLVGSDLIARMKRGVYLVNIARGAVIDYDALLAGLRSNHIAGVGLDVFWREPFDPDDPLLRENVIATPHIAGVTHASLNGIGQAVATSVEALRRGETPPHCVNPDAAFAARDVSLRVATHPAPKS